MPAIVTPERQELLTNAMRFHKSGMPWREIGERVGVTDAKKLKSLQSVINRKAREETGWRR